MSYGASASTNAGTDRTEWIKTKENTGKENAVFSVEQIYVYDFELHKIENVTACMVQYAAIDVA